MNKIYYKLTIFVVLLTSLTSCDSWLDVAPRSEINNEKLFASENGFKDALIGSYTEIAGTSLYGRNTTMYFPELLAKHWMPTTSDKDAMVTARAINEYNYSHKFVEPAIRSIWLSYYKAIAGLNYLNENLEATTIIFSPKTKELIEGEILGLRAFLHVDLLRYFAPIPALANNEKAIPYILETSRTPAKLRSLPYNEVVERILTDLTSAEEILAEVDPAIDNTSSINSLKPTSPDWYINRNARFNYYAVLATKARLYHWIGDRENATIYAKKVLDQTVASWKFVLGDANTVDPSNTNSNLVLLSEHIFSIHNRNTESTALSLYGQKESIILFHGDAVEVRKILDKLTEEDTNITDIRNFNNYWKSTPQVSDVTAESLYTFHYQKYSSQNTKITNRIPLIRLSEMYFILMENLPLDEAKKRLEEFAFKRSMVVAPLLASINTKEDMLLRLEKEYRKDFFGEGQMFFFYKRLNYKSFPWPAVYPMADERKYTLPLPDDQVSFE